MIFDLGFEITKVNPCHVPSGPKGGQFCSRGASLSPASENRDEWPDHIKALKLPPAWTGVRVNPDPNGALLAIGKDSKGRDQYVYSKKFQDSQAETKFARIKSMEKEYDAMWKQNARIGSRGDEIRQDHADCAALVMRMGLRPGSDAETGAKVKAYGATTLLGRHVVSGDDGVRLQFVGKKGVGIDLPVKDRDILKMLAERAKRAGSDGKLFPSVNERSLSEHVHSLDAGRYKTKDFRTHLATSEAARMVASMKAPTNAKEYKKSVLTVAKVVSSKLGNTPTVALQSYIHPGVFGGWKMEAGA